MPNALLGAEFNAFLNRSLDDEIRSLMWRHGADEVRAATRRVTAKKRGRKPEHDWLQLHTYIEQDAADWLDGKDPIAARTNYAIARAISETHPGHSAPSTHRRLMRKLSKSRLPFILYEAMRLAEQTRPYADLLRVLNALIELDGIPRKIGLTSIDHRMGQLKRYEETFGQPADEMTFAAIQLELDKPIAFPKPVTLSGFLGSRTA